MDTPGGEGSPFLDPLGVHVVEDEALLDHVLHHQPHQLAHVHPTEQRIGPLQEHGRVVWTIQKEKKNSLLAKLCFSYRAGGL